jgi:hypothetical protein
MTAKREAGRDEATVPALARADGGRLLQEAMLLLLGGQPRERGVQRVVALQEALLAVQDRRIGGRVVVQAKQLPRPQGQPHRAGQGREKGSGPICAKHPEGRLRQMGPDPFSHDRPGKKGDWLRCAKHPKGRQATVPVPLYAHFKPPVIMVA